MSEYQIVAPSSIEAFIRYRCPSCQYKNELELKDVLKRKTRTVWCQSCDAKFKALGISKFALTPNTGKVLTEKKKSVRQEHQYPKNAKIVRGVLLKDGYSSKEADRLLKLAIVKAEHNTVASILMAAYSFA
jgi:ribosomal protein L37AE/L43A